MGAMAARAARRRLGAVRGPGGPAPAADAAARSFLPGTRTLRRYVARRFLFSMMGAFVVCSCLIFMIDMIELLRLSRRATDLSIGTLLWIGLLRLPAFAELLLAFAVLVGSIGALLSLNRRSELIVMRSSGMSVWQFLRPGIVVTLILGVLAVTLFNPLAARPGPSPSGWWRRCSAWRPACSRQGRGVVAAAGRRRRPVGGARPRCVRPGPDPDGRDRLPVRPRGAVHRASRRRARHPAGRLLGAAAHNGVPRQSGNPRSFKTYAISTHLTRERVGDALGSEIAVSFWQLPELIEVSERAGLSASKYRMQQAVLLARPALLIAMVVLAATVSLRSFRSGGIQTMVLFGLIGGIGLFLLG